MALFRGFADVGSQSLTINLSSSFGRAAGAGGRGIDGHMVGVCPQRKDGTGVDLSHYARGKSWLSCGICRDPGSLQRLWEEIPPLFSAFWARVRSSNSWFCTAFWPNGPMDHGPISSDFSEEVVALESLLHQHGLFAQELQRELSMVVPGFVPGPFPLGCEQCLSGWLLIFWGSGPDSKRFE